MKGRWQPNIDIKHATSIIKMHLLHAPWTFSDELAFLEYFGVFSIFDIHVDSASIASIATRSFGDRDLFSTAY